MLPIRKILCPTDFSEPSFTALAKATELAAHFGARLCLLHVTPTISPVPTNLLVVSVSADYYEHSMQADAAQRLHKLLKTHVPENIDAYPLIRGGDAATEIVRTAEEENADLLVISTHGLTGWRHLVFGSVAETVVRLARCPVLTVHNEKRSGSTSLQDGTTGNAAVKEK